MIFDSKKPLFWVLLTVLIFGCGAVLQYKFKFLGELPSASEISVGMQPAAPPMPETKKEVKSEPVIKSPVLEMALKQEREFNAKKTRRHTELKKKFAEERIKVWVSFYVELDDAVAFFES